VAKARDLSGDSAVNAVLCGEDGCLVARRRCRSSDPPRRLLCTAMVQSTKALGVLLAAPTPINDPSFPPMKDLTMRTITMLLITAMFSTSCWVGAEAGSFPAVIELKSLDGHTGFRLDGARAGDYTGSSVSGTDINLDGLADPVIGAPLADPNGRRDAGTSYVVFGKTSAFHRVLELSKLDGIVGFKVKGPVPIEYVGWSVASAGDVTNDGFPDFVLGAPLVGSSYVVFGKASGFAPNLKLSELDGTNGFKLKLPNQPSDTRRPVAGAGDVNGDDFADVVVGDAGAAPNGSDSGSSYVVFGRASGFPANMKLSTLDGATGFRLDGAAEDASGASVAGAGDFNGDGFGDVIIGAPNSSPHGRFRAGVTYVVFGRASGFPASINLSSLDGTTGFKLSGEAADDQSGWSVASAGDVNRDGYSDLIIGVMAPITVPGRRARRMLFLVGPPPFLPTSSCPVSMAPLASGSMERVATQAASLSRVPVISMGMASEM
jgi:hypothetical protein